MSFSLFWEKYNFRFLDISIDRLACLCVSMSLFFLNGNSNTNTISDCPSDLFPLLCFSKYYSYNLKSVFYRYSSLIYWQICSDYYPIHISEPIDDDDPNLMNQEKNVPFFQMLFCFWPVDIFISFSLTNMMIIIMILVRWCWCWWWWTYYIWYGRFFFCFFFL